LLVLSLLLHRLRPTLIDGYRVLARCSPSRSDLDLAMWSLNNRAFAGYRRSVAATPEITSCFTTFRPRRASSYFGSSHLCRHVLGEAWFGADVFHAFRAAFYVSLS